MGRDFPEGNRDFQEIPHQWNKDHLVLLRDLSYILPAHFRKLPGESQVTIILSNINHCNDTDPDSPPGQIQLDHKKLQASSKGEALEGLTHELTHVMTPKEIIMTPNPISPYLPTTEEMRSSWFAMVGGYTRRKLCRKRT